MNSTLFYPCVVVHADSWQNTPSSHGTTPGGSDNRFYKSVTAIGARAMLPGIMRSLAWIYAILWCCSWATQAAESLTRTEVIYGRKFGTALTLDVLQPANTNGYGVCAMISGGFYSSHEAIQVGFFKELLDRGYTVFAVVHGSQPRYQIPEIYGDIHRAIRFVRANAANYSVRPDRLGILGASAGGNLSLTLGTQGKPGDPAAKDPIDRESSAVQAVACFFPPTDFMNWSSPGDNQTGIGPVGRQFYGAFGSRSDKPETRDVLGREISPLYFVTSAMPPTLIIHGEVDKLVPIYQAEIFAQRAAQVGATCRVIRKPGADHGWPGMEKDVAAFADWFDVHLREKRP